MADTVFIYGLRDPRDKEIKYVGRTSRPRRRLVEHIKDAHRSNTPKNAWVLALRQEGLRPEMVILEEASPSKWEAAERGWIERLRREGTGLKNVDDGGRGRRGYVVSAETRRKLSGASKGRKLSERHKLALSVANTGRRHTEETKRRISEANTGKKRTAEFKACLSARMSGRPKTAEHRAKISAAQRGRVFSEETRRKMSAARANWHPPAELTRIQREKCRGEGNGRSKLTADQVLEIRKRYASGGISLPRLAAEYPVCAGTVHRIVTGKLWKHI